MLILLLQVSAEMGVEAALRFEYNAANILIKSINTNQENIRDNNSIALSDKNLSTRYG
jgi:hypothetical protein